MKKYILSLVYLLFCTVMTAQNTSDQKFIQEALKGGEKEISLGQSASLKGTDKRISEFGSMMVTEHKKANQQLTNLAQKKGFSLPDNSNTSMTAALHVPQNSSFDKMFIETMINDHKEAITLYENQLRTTDDTDIKVLINELLPLLKKHLEEAEQINQTLTLNAKKESGIQKVRK